MDDIRNNHPNDSIGLAYFSTAFKPNWEVDAGYKSVVAPLSQDFTRLKNSLFYPLTMVKNGDILNPTKELRPYDGSFNYTGRENVPNAQSGTDPNTGFALAYNILTPSNHPSLGTTAAERGRRGASKIVIFETDGVPTSTRNVTFTPAGVNSYYTVQNTGDPYTAPQTAALAVVDQIVAPMNTGGTAASGFSTPNNTARVYAIGFGDLFTTDTIERDAALDFLRDVQIRGKTLPPSLSTTPGKFALPPDHIVGGTFDQRLEKLRRAFQTIMQNGVQVTLIE
jgi:hypothetical protein